MMNAKNPPYKVSNVFKLMNFILYSVFGFQLVLIILYATFSVIWQKGNSEKHIYLVMDPEIDAGTWFIQLLTYWVAYSHLIPISLYVGLEILKLGLSMQINGDYGMYDHETD
jgi:phospholipid-transporting ATPase